MGQPSTLTPEEEFLLKKFALLKRKRKILQKTKDKVDHSGSPTTVKPGLKREAPPVTEVSQRPEDAKEKAKKLIASGTVKIKKDPVHREFKRAKIDRKQKDPFQQSSTSRTDQSTAVKRLYESFIPSGRNHNRRMSGSGGHRRYHDDEPKRGNTIFVKGCGLMESHLEKPFSKFGKVQRISFEREKSHGFVTFETPEQAENAIEEMNGTMISGVCIKVSFARRQPNLSDTHTHGRAELWSSRDAKGYSHSSQKEHREILAYDEDF